MSINIAHSDESERSPRQAIILDFVAFRSVFETLIRSRKLLEIDIDIIAFVSKNPAFCSRFSKFEATFNTLVDTSNT